MAVDNPGEYAIYLADKFGEAAGHLANVRSQVEDLMNEHSALYDGDGSQTGNETRGQLQGVLDELESQVGLLHTIQDSVRDHGERIIAASQS